MEFKCCWNAVSLSSESDQRKKQLSINLFNAMQNSELGEEWIFSSSRAPIIRLAYDGAQLVPIAVPRVWI